MGSKTETLEKITKNSFLRKLKIIVDIGHPAHVHFFKNFIWKMQEIGHEVLVTASDKDVALDLLNKFGFDYINMGKCSNNILFKIINAAWSGLKMLKVVSKFRPDLIVGIASIRGPHAGFLFRKKSVNFDDTEHSQIEIKLYLPFVDRLYCPECFARNLGPKQIRYKGYHELAYLHSHRFKPNRSVLDEMGLKKNEKLFIIRFVSWGAVHDIGQHGFKDEDKEQLIQFLETQGRVLITSEVELPPHLKKYQSTDSTKIHDLLYYATLYIGEGATMASEAAVLGTPSIYINTLKLGYLQEQQTKYGLVFCYSDSEKVLEKVKELLAIENLKSLWQEKKNKLLREKIDTTDLLIQLVENLNKESKV